MYALSHLAAHLQVERGLCLGSFCSSRSALGLLQLLEHGASSPAAQ